MSTSTVRAVLALTIVGVFMLITGVMAIYPLFSPGNVQLDMYADFFSKTASVYTGIVGVIIGYYFGRSVDRNTKPGELNNGETVTTTDH
jgi:uncharacterized membrane protein HdeD (DUF308 family)